MQKLRNIMPKAPGSSSPVKNEPYGKESPKKQRAGAAASSKITWTEEMDKTMISHVLSISEIKLHYNWTDLQKNHFPHLTVKQVCHARRAVLRRGFILAENLPR